MSKRYNFQEVSGLKHRLRADLGSVVAVLFPDRPCRPVGPEWRLGNHGSLSIDRTGRFYCHEAGEGGDVIDLIRFAFGCDFPSALVWASRFAGGSATPPTPRHSIPPQERAEKQSRAAARLFSKSMLAQGTVVETYLASRGLHPSPWPEEVRYLPSAWNFTTQKKHPAMLCAVRNLEGAVMAVHQTFLTPEGGKISGEGVRARLFMGAVKGGAIRLAPATHRLALAEGVEDALSIMQATGWLCWAVGSASNFQNVLIPDTVREVRLCADSDEAGIRGAHAAASRLQREGREVRIALPPGNAKDWNEALEQEGAV